MPILLIALFIVFPIVEILVLVQFGQSFGFWWTVLLILSTGIAGTLVLQHQGFQVMNRTMEALSAGRPPIGPVVDGAFIMLAGVLLITPGIISDVMGALLLVPWIRHRVAAWSVRQALKAGRVQVDIFSRRTTTGETRQRDGYDRAGAPPHASPAADGPIIEGDFERLDERPVNGRSADGRGRGDDRGPPRGPAAAGD